MQRFKNAGLITSVPKLSWLAKWWARLEKEGVVVGDASFASKDLFNVTESIRESASNLGLDIVLKDSDFEDAEKRTGAPASADAGKYILPMFEAGTCTLSFAVDTLGIPTVVNILRAMQSWGRVSDRSGTSNVRDVLEVLIEGIVDTQSSRSVARFAKQALRRFGAAAQVSSSLIQYVNDADGLDVEIKFVRNLTLADPNVQSSALLSRFELLAGDLPLFAALVKESVDLAGAVTRVCED